MIQAEQRGAGVVDPPGPPQPLSKIETGTYSDELKGMTDRAFLLTERHQGQHMRAERAGADPRILEFERKFLRRTSIMGVPVFAHCVNRDGSEQNRLFLQGHTKAKAGQSPHNFGCAVDLVHGTRAWNLTRKQWEILGHVGKEVAKTIGVKIVWGGDWDFYDPAHWELADWRDVRDQYSDIDGLT